MALGVPHGASEVHYPGGGTYTGEMRRGQRQGVGTWQRFPRALRRAQVLYTRLRRAREEREALLRLAWERRRRKQAAEEGEERDTPRELPEGFDPTAVASLPPPPGLGRHERFVVAYRGEWRHGEPRGWGTIHFSDGSVYTGRHANCVFTGTGQWECVDGTVADGYFRYVPALCAGAQLRGPSPLTRALAFTVGDCSSRDR